MSVLINAENFPDHSFRNYITETLLGNSSATEISTETINTITNIDVQNLEISDLSGIEYFTSITSLNCANNSLTTLNLINNLSLETINCSANNIKTLSLGTNSNLVTLNCANNKIAELNLNSATNLETLICDNNNLLTLNLRVNTALTSLDCSNNLLETLDLSLNTGLTSLACNNNRLSELDLSENTNLASVTVSPQIPTGITINNSGNTIYPYLVKLDSYIEDIENISNIVAKNVEEQNIVIQYYGGNLLLTQKPATIHYAYATTYGASENIEVNVTRSAYPAITKRKLAEAIKNQNYNEKITVNSNSENVTYSIIKGTLPPGLFLDSQTGIISGTIITPLITPTLTLSSSEVTVGTNQTSTISITTNSNGSPIVTSNNPEIATATISANVVSVNGVGIGTTAITVLIPSTDTYSSVVKTIAISVIDGRDSPNLSLSPSAATTTVNNTTTITASYNGDGVLSAESNDTSIATVSVTGKTITITGVSIGATTLNISVSGTSSYKSEATTARVEISAISSTLDNNSWADIAAIGAAGTGDTYWDVGDTKTITLNGTVGTLALSNVQLKVFIIDFNYGGENGVYFQGFKTTSGVDVALCDGSYNSNKTDGTKVFNINHWGNYNYGGWEGCDLRYDILGSTSTAPSGYGYAKTTSVVGYDATTAAKTSPVANTLMAALPADLRSAMSLWTVYTDNKGNSSNVAANVTVSKDYLVLLSEFEVHGSRTYANQYEPNSQSQMAYYRNGNSKTKYNHSNTSLSVFWWLRSAHYSSSSIFCSVYTGGSATAGSAAHSRGVAPSFRVANDEEVKN